MAIELGFVGTPPIVVAPELFDTFKRDYAQVELSFRELRFPTGSTAGWLESVDVALCFSPTAHEDVATQTLWREPRALLVGADHRFADAEALDVEDVLDEPFYGHHETVDPLWAGFWTLDDHRGGPARLTADRPVSSLELIATISSGRALRAFSSSTARTIARVLDKLVAVPLRDAAPAACELAWSRAHAGPLVQTLVETARAIGESTSGKARATEARASVRR
ncbi:MAG TPA: LysR substrate-binding domain-containing protein [Solirubrobacteraceae bacterium]|nr:LysR substrate-binding domain-containing protein [Solirubrobacteraceae bacterium]